MFERTLSAAVLSAAGAALVGGALAFAPSSQATPGTDTQPPCLTAHTCALLIPPSQDGQGPSSQGQAKYLPLTPPSSGAQYAPLTPR